MNDPGWQEVKQVFQAAIDLPVVERGAFVDEVCGGDEDLRHEVTALLQSLDDAGSFIEEPAAVSHPVEDELEGRRIGPYEVLAELGRGGMGSVYLARRADEVFEKKVAIKLVRRGLESEELLRRFTHERRILAGLDHPAIARLHDGGTANDSPSW